MTPLSLHPFRPLAVNYVHNLYLQFSYMWPSKPAAVHYSPCLLIAPFTFWFILLHATSRVYYTLTMTWLFVAYVLSISEIVLADRAPFFRDQEYDNGDYGGFPIEKYTTTSLVAPRANFYQYGGQCDDDGLYVMITPRGGDVEMPGPMILDGNGTLVWTNIAYRQPYNLQMQIYRGEQYLTFWAGNDAVRGHGAGMYYMVSFNLACPRRKGLWTLTAEASLIPPTTKPMSLARRMAVMETFTNSRLPTTGLL